MPLQTFLTSIGMITLAELGDKTMLTTICLSAQSRNSRIVLLATLLALSLATAIAVLIGYFLAMALPIQAIAFISGILFVILGLYTITSHNGDDVETCSNPTGFLGIMSLVLVSELGDKSQLAILALAAYSAYPILVFLGAIGGFFIVSTLGAAIGDRIAVSAHIKHIHLAAGVVFIIIGTLTIIGIL